MTRQPVELPVPRQPGSPSPVPRRAQHRTSLLARGEPMVWLTGGALVIALAMIVGLLGLIIVQGLGTFWPSDVVEVQTHEGKTYLGEETKRESYRADDNSPALSGRRQLRTGNFELTKTHYTWVADAEVKSESRPEWALVIERFEWGRFYGTPEAFLTDGQVATADTAAVWSKVRELHDQVLETGRQRYRLEKIDKGYLEEEKRSLEKVKAEAEREHGRGSPRHVAASKKLADFEAQAVGEHERLDAEIQRLKHDGGRYQLRLRTADGQLKDLPLAEVVRAYPANQLDFGDKLKIYSSRWGEFLWDGPRAANSEGGVFPAIWGTVIMTLFMSLAVVPLGVIAALYLREYAKAGPIVSVVRIAINNLAGVPSIVFGMFGLVFFCYMLGGQIDDVFCGGEMTYRKGGLLWASLTLALLTLPVVIVATEEALAAVPNSMREGSYACGASKWQTIRRIVLPRALPGILTGMILAMARGAGEVAPIMLVGAVKIAPELPVDASPPFVHPERSFMHLGFHIFDVGFQSQNSEAGKPMVYTTTLLLIVLIAVLNVTAVWLRSRLRRRFQLSKF